MQPPAGLQEGAGQAGRWAGGALRGPSWLLLHRVPAARRSRLQRASRLAGPRRPALPLTAGPAPSLSLPSLTRSLNQALVDGLRAALACGEPASTEFEAGEPAAVMSSEQTGSSAPSDFLEAASGTTTDAEGLDAPIAGSETAGAVDAGAVDAAALAEPIAGSEPVTDGTPAEFADAASVAAAAIEGSGAGVDASQPIAGSEAAPVRRRRLLLL